MPTIAVRWQADAASWIRCPGAGERP